MAPALGDRINCPAPSFAPAQTSALGTAGRLPCASECTAWTAALQNREPVCVCVGVKLQKQLIGTPMTEHEIGHSDLKQGEILIEVSLVLLGGDQDLLQPRLLHWVRHTRFLFSAGLGLREPGTAFQVTGTWTVSSWVLCGQKQKVLLIPGL